MEGDERGPAEGHDPEDNRKADTIGGRTRASKGLPSGARKERLSGAAP